VVAWMIGNSPRLGVGIVWGQLKPDHQTNGTLWKKPGACGANGQGRKT